MARLARVVLAGTAGLCLTGCSSAGHPRDATPKASARRTTPSTAVPTISSSGPVGPASPDPCAGTTAATSGDCLISISFVDHSLGFGVVRSDGASSPTPELVRTDNAGVSWQPVASLPAATTQQGADPSVLFVSRADGVVYGATGTYLTHDGGRTWSALSFPGIVGASSRGAAILLVDGTCAPYGLPPGQSHCGLGLESSPDAGRTWSALGLPAGTYGFGQAVEGPAGQVVLGEWRGVGADFEGPGLLAVSTDGGASWTTHSLPCPRGYRLGGHLSIDWASATTWLVCSGQGSGGTLGIVIYRSGSLGASWVPESSFALGGPTGVPPGAPGGKLEGLVATSATDAVALEMNGGLVRTTDGGVTWKPVAPADELGGFRGSLDMVDADYGFVALWVDAGRYRGLWRTTDGGATWGPAPRA